MNRGLLALALALLSVNACVPPAVEPADAAVSPPAAGDPTLANRTDALRAMDNAYDLLLRDAGVTGTVHAELALNADGTVREVRVVDSTHERFTSSARQAAPRFRFTPPAQPGTSVRVRMQFIYRRGEIGVLGVVAGAPAAP